MIIEKSLQAPALYITTIIEMSNYETRRRHAAAPDRDCGRCTLCCKILAVPEINKAAANLCIHCSEGQGCRIYDSRPKMCRLFHCHFLENRRLREIWRPSKSHIVLVVSSDGQRIGAHVDPSRPGAWKREPYYSTLKRWSREVLLRPDQIGQVFVCVGKRTTVVLPNRNVDVGDVEADEFVITESSNGVLSAFKIKRDDPRACRALEDVPKNARKGALF